MVSLPVPSIKAGSWSVASELITNREIVSARIRDDLLNRAKEFNIMLEDVSIVSSPCRMFARIQLTIRHTWRESPLLTHPFPLHLAGKWRIKLINRFGKEFTTAVEQKQIAQQDAERAKFVVEKAEQERQAAVIRAEGEAEAANTISKALNRAGDAFVQFRKIEAAREIGMFLSSPPYLSCFLSFPPSLFRLLRPFIQSSNHLHPHYRVLAHHLRYTIILANSSLFLVVTANNQPDHYQDPRMSHMSQQAVEIY